MSLNQRVSGCLFSGCNGNQTTGPDIEIQIIQSSKFVVKVGPGTDMFGLIDQQQNLSELDQTKDVFRKMDPLN